MWRFFSQGDTATQGGKFVNWGMRWMFILFFVATISVHAQVQTTWIGDTAKVSYMHYDGDTSYYLRKKDSRSGVWIIYYDSLLNQRAERIHYKNDFPKIDTAWNRNGTFRKIYLSKDSITHGCYDSESWYPSGTLKCTTSCDGDSSLQILYYPNGQIKEKLYSWRDSVPGNWIVNHIHYQYYENGHLKSDPSDINGPRQTIKNYYESGKVSRETTWQAGALIGPYHEWYENGQLKVEGKYKIPPNDHGFHGTTQIGTWSYYNESGKLIKEEFYEEGKLVKTIEY